MKNDRSPRFVIGMILLLAAVVLITWLVSRARAAGVPVSLPEGVTLDPRTWVASATVLAATVAVIIQYVKPFLPFLKGATTRWAAMGLSVLIPVLVEAFAPDVIDGNIVSAIAMGVAAAVGAGGAKDFIRSTRGEATPPDARSGTLPR